MRVDSAKIVEPTRSGERGMALLTAVGFLVLFSLLGTAYVRFMALEQEAAHLTVQEARTRAAARGGIEAALGMIEEANRAGRLSGVLDQVHVVDLVAYKLVNEGAAGRGLAESERRAVRANVRISDESGKVNLNHAPPSVLRRVLNVDGATARAIANAVPRSGERAEGRRWFTHVDELLARGLLTEAQFAGVDPALVTVYSVLDHDDPVDYLNINGAPPGVLAAALDVTTDEATAIAEKRPFTGIRELTAAANKTADAFSYRPSSVDDSKKPNAFTFDSRCFRIVSEAVVARRDPGGAEYRSSHATVEAVVVMNDEGGFDVARWQLRGGKSET